MGWKISLYRDRDYIGSLPLATQSLIKKQKLLTNGGQNISYVGLLFQENSVDVFLPRNSSIDVIQSDKIQIASLVLNAVELYGKSFNSPLTLEDSELENQIGGTSLSLISELLEDYQQNGIYAKRKAVNTLNTGKPNWSKTISKSVAYPSNSNYIYLDVHSSKKITQSICEVAKIHLMIVSEICKRFSVFLFGHELLVKEHAISAPAITSLQGQIHALEKELRITYSERDIWLIKSLISYLKKIKGKSDSSMMIGIKHFHTVWEFMLSKTLINTVNLNKILPIPSYKTNDGKIVPAPLKGQRLDIVLKNPDTNHYAVVDAKYYSAGSVSSAPGWPDLVKQFFYAKSLKEIVPDANVDNAFVFPASGGPLKSAHMQNRQSLQLLDNEYGVIDCFYIDPVEVMYQFVNNLRLVELSDSILSRSKSV